MGVEREEISGWSGEFTEQPGSGEGPVPFNSRFGDSELLGALGDRHAAEEFHFDQLSMARMALGQKTQRLIERHKIRKEPIARLFQQRIRALIEGGRSVRQYAVSTHLLAGMVD
jgi:hypothetical protein